MEYSLIAGLAVAILMIMAPLVRRGAQGMIKIVADQVGEQEESEQVYDDIEAGYLDYSYTTTRALANKKSKQRLWVFNTIYSESTSSSSNALMSLGFTNTME